MGFSAHQMVELNQELIDFLEKKEFFELKLKTDKQVNDLLYYTQQKLAELWKSRPIWSLPDGLSSIPSKISRGNNHSGYPFQVFDFPSSFSQTDIFTFRVIVWYGRHFSCNLIASGIFLRYVEDRLPALANKNTRLLLDDNPWSNSLLETHNLLIDKESITQATTFIKKNQSIRLFRLFSMNQINSIHRLTLECFNDWFSADLA